MMFGANLNQQQRLLLFPHAFSTAEKLHGLEIVEVDGTAASRYEHAGEEVPKWTNNMVPFGKAGIVRKTMPGAKKLDPRGVPMMMVGYAEDHSEDVYLMWNPATKQVVLSRDVIWLPRMLFQKKNRANEIHVNDDDDDSIEEVPDAEAREGETPVP